LIINKLEKSTKKVWPYQKIFVYLYLQTKGICNADANTLQLKQKGSSNQLKP